VGGEGETEQTRVDPRTLTSLDLVMYSYQHLQKILCRAGGIA
jgi:hypothetical protein